MSHDDLLHEVCTLGCHLRRQSERHHIYVNPSTGRKASIPRHKEIPESLARLIKKHLRKEPEL